MRLPASFTCDWGKMTSRKQKWSAEEIKALIGGVEKYSTGRWKNILEDPDFGPVLSNRSNVDIKDKWRNLEISGVITRTAKEKATASRNVAPKTRDNSPAEKATASRDVAPKNRNNFPIEKATGSRAVTPETRNNSPIEKATGSRDVAPETQNNSPIEKATGSRLVTPETRNNSPISISGGKANENHPQVPQEVKKPTIDNDMILKAISSMKDPSGTDVGAVMRFIERVMFIGAERVPVMLLKNALDKQKYEAPQNFRRLLTSKMRRLVLQGKLEKVKNGYKIKDAALGTKTPTPKQKDLRPRPLQPSVGATFKETMIDAATTVANEIAKAENKAFVAGKAVEESERISQAAEETETRLTLCKELLQTHDRDEFIPVD